MRLAFMGTPQFAVPALRALHGAGHDIAAVYCQPPRPAGRRQEKRPCAIQVEAERLGLTVRTPARLRTDQDVQSDFLNLRLDVAVVAAYGLILPQAMLDAPVHGCLNIHASLLPRWRGAAPIQAAILAGDTETGITIMKMDAGLDTGAILLRKSEPITPSTTSSELQDRLADLGASLILEALSTWPNPEPQPIEGVTYAAKLKREDGRINWTNPAEYIDRQIRAFDPWPGTFTTHQGTVLKVIAATPTSGSGVPGTILDDRLTVACGTGAIRLTRLQAPGRAALTASEFLRGHPIGAGTVLE